MQSSGGFLSPEAFAALPYEDQQDYIQKMANKANDPNTSPAVRGAIAMHLRHLRSTGAMSDEFLDQFMSDYEEFFNDDLRKAMNRNYDGSHIYTKHQMKNERDENGKKMWEWMCWPGDSMHQNEKRGGRNKKYVGRDGRESVFYSDWSINHNKQDIATYNYSKGTLLSSMEFTVNILGIWKYDHLGKHKKYDMDPYVRQMNKK